LCARLGTSISFWESTMNVVICIESNKRIERKVTAESMVLFLATKVRMEEEHE
jgi:hypothetical protein